MPSHEFISPIRVSLITNTASRDLSFLLPFFSLPPPPLPLSLSASISFSVSAALSCRLSTPDSILFSSESEWKTTTVLKRWRFPYTHGNNGRKNSETALDEIYMGVDYTSTPAWYQLHPLHTRYILETQVVISSKRLTESERLLTALRLRSFLPLFSSPISFFLYLFLFVSSSLLLRFSSPLLLSKTFRFSLSRTGSFSSLWSPPFSS